MANRHVQDGDRPDRERRLAAAAAALIAALGAVACDEQKGARYSVEEKATPMPAPRLAARERCYGIAWAQAKGRLEKPLANGMVS